MPIKFVIREESLLDRAIWVPEASLSVQQIILKATFLHFTVDMNELGIAVQEMILVEAHVEDLLADVAAIAIKAILAMFIQYHLSFECKLLGVVMIKNADTTDLCLVLEVRPVLHFDQFPHSPYPKVFFENELVVIVQLSEIKASRLQVLIEEISSFATFEKLMDGSIEYLLQYFKFVARPLTEKVFIDAPEFELHL